MVFPLPSDFLSIESSLRGAKRRSNPDLLCGAMDCFASLAMTALGTSLPPRQLLRALPEHVLPRLLIKWLLHELPDRQSHLHLWPRAHVSVPALDVRIIVKRKAL